MFIIVTVEHSITGSIPGINLQYSIQVIIVMHQNIVNIVLWARHELSRIVVGKYFGEYTCAVYSSKFSFSLYRSSNRYTKVLFDIPAYHLWFMV